MQPNFLARFCFKPVPGRPVALVIRAPRYNKAGKLIPQNSEIAAEQRCITTQSSADYNEGRALQYAKWLAARDGVELPKLKTKCVWSGVYRGARWQRRIRAVEWGRDEDVYNTRKDGRRGAWLYTRFVPELTIEIPNWDFDPEPIAGLDSHDGKE